MVDLDQRFIAMIALSVDKKLDSKVVALHIKTLFPDIAGDVGEPPEGEPGNNSFVIPVGDSLIAVLPFTFPIPVETLVPAITNELMWQDAAQQFEKSKAHILFSVLSEKDGVDHLKSCAQNLTYAVAAALKELPMACGVYWSTAEQVIEPGRFSQEALQAGGNGIPLDLWIGYRFFKGKNYDHDEKIVCRTSGLQIFRGREVEVGPDSRAPGNLAKDVLAIARHLLETGMSFQEGHTIGSTEEPEAFISLEHSDYGGNNMPIFRLNMIDDMEGKK